MGGSFFNIWQPYLGVALELWSFNNTDVNFKIAVMENWKFSVPKCIIGLQMSVNTCKFIILVILYLLIKIIFTI